MTAETWVWLLKFAHVSAIALWVGGLLSMPYLIWQRNGLRENVGDEAVFRLHRAVRMVHVGMTSPAAVVAIGTGVPLIFLRQTYDAWFMAKLVFVGVLVLAHNIASRTERKVFADDPVEGDPDEGLGGRRVCLSAGRALALGLMVAVGSSGVLLTVLGKPEWSIRALAPELLQPGALGPYVARLIPRTY